MINYLIMFHRVRLNFIELFTFFTFPDLNWPPDLPKKVVVFGYPLKWKTDPLGGLNQCLTVDISILAKMEVNLIFLFILICIDGPRLIDADAKQQIKHRQFISTARANYIKVNIQIFEKKKIKIFFWILFWVFPLIFSLMSKDWVRPCKKLV